MGAWVSYGLGSMNKDLPAFVALTSNGAGKSGQPLYDRLWGSGFLPGRFKESNSVGKVIRFLTFIILQA